MKLFQVVLIILAICVESQSSFAQFGSAPLKKTSSANQPTSSAISFKTGASTAASRSQPPVSQYSGAAATQAPVVGSSGGKRWFQHDSGYIIAVDADAVPGPGFHEVAAPAQPAQSAVSAAPAQAYSTGPQAYTSAPQTYTPAPQTYTPPRNTYTPQAMTQPSYAQPQMSTGVQPGKKWMQHKSGYRVIVDQNTAPGPEFVEIPAPSSAPAMTQPYAQMQQPQAQAYSPLMAQGGGAQPQTYSQIPMTSPYGQQPAQSAYQPSLSNVPPNMQRQLPYQPPTPPGMAPAQVPMYQQQAPAYGGYGQAGAKPAVRSAPPGKKWVQQEGGMRYLVDQSTIPGPGFRELTDEEASKPIMIMGPQQQQQQQQPQQQGGFFNFLKNLGTR